MEFKMKRILKGYKELIGTFWDEAPFMVIITFMCTILKGLSVPIGAYINQNIFDGGISVARGETFYQEYMVSLILFVIATLLPEVLTAVIFNYVQPRSRLILRTTVKAQMLEKIKTMKYEHLESEASAEIIDKAYNRTENAAMHLWPMYVYWRFSALIASICTLIYFASVKWWLIITILVPFLIETYISTKNNYNIYNELERLWKNEKKYTQLGVYLKNRNYITESKANGNATYLIETYSKRLNERNRNYEHYYLKNLKKNAMGGCLTQIGVLLNVCILLFLFLNGQMSIGLFIALTGILFNEVYNNLESFVGFFKWSGMHINTYEYYDRFFELSDEETGEEVVLPEVFDIEFRNVWFKYPGTDKEILKGMSFKINSGEKVALVGKNGEGKTTIIKLLLGLFSPDKGEILIGGKRIDSFSISARAKIFGPVFQDFTKYNLTVKENIGVGDVMEMDDNEKIINAAKKAGIHDFIEGYENKYDTLLGKDFENAVDVSGGQWQKIAIARAFMGDKPVLILDEPTSQIDPMAEAELYKKFTKMASEKTAILITHRLGATMITDRIMVISDGRIEEIGTHEELMRFDGIYAAMFESQKQWYNNKVGTVNE